jgi:hypothetical protein
MDPRTLITANTPINKANEETALAETLADANKYMPGNPIIAKILNGRAPEEAAKELIANTKLDDVEFRKQLLEGGKEAIENSTDPLIVLMRAVNPDVQKINEEYAAKSGPLQQRAQLAYVNVAKARFAVDGLKNAPDANFTLRLSYGVVKGYKDNGQKIPWATTIGGAYELCDRKSDKFPYDVPPRWHETKTKLDLNTPFNVASTPDIIGGNSGSPVVNTKGEVVGIIFDGNIQSLPWNFMYDDQVGRSVHADGRAILESLRKVYKAEQLAGELAGTGSAQGGASH